MRPTSAVLLAGSFFLAGCAQVAIVVKEQPEAARTFTVIPAAYDSAELAMAGRVEQELLRNGLRIIERPAFRYMATDRLITESAGQAAGLQLGNALVGGGSSRSVSSVAKITDTVSMYADTKASHIVVTSAAGRIRIIERESNLLVGSIAIGGGFDGMVSSIHAGLVLGGFVKDGTMEKRCQLVNPDPPKPPETKPGP